MLQRIDLSGMHTIKVDLQDAEYQVPVQRSDRKYFAFKFAGHYYNAIELPVIWVVELALVFYRGCKRHGDLRTNATHHHPSCSTGAHVSHAWHGFEQQQHNIVKVLPYLGSTMDFMFQF